MGVLKPIGNRYANAPHSNVRPQNAGIWAEVGIIRIPPQSHALPGTDSTFRFRHTPRARTVGAFGNWTAAS
jgi:hypothetical protein